MPLFMDIHHHVDGLTADAVKGAHEADLKTQDELGVHYLQYWFDEGSGKVFCLVEAPNAEAAAGITAPTARWQPRGRWPAGRGRRVPRRSAQPL